MSGGGPILCIRGVDLSIIHLQERNYLSGFSFHLRVTIEGMLEVCSHLIFMKNELNWVNSVINCVHTAMREKVNAE